MLAIDVCCRFDARDAARQPTAAGAPVFATHNAKLFRLAQIGQRSFRGSRASRLHSVTGTHGLALRRYHVRREIPSLSQGLMSSLAMCPDQRFAAPAAPRRLWIAESFSGLKCRHVHLRNALRERTQLAR